MNATIPAKGDHPAKVGLIAHMDTSDGVRGATKPVCIPNYDGKAITLKNGVVIDGFKFLPSLAGQELIVTERATGFKPDVKNFRQFYKTMLILSLEGVAPLNDEEKAALVNDPSKCQLELTFITDSTTLEYKFYPYSERRSFYTINGEGEFYVLRSMVDKVIADADRITRDEPVDSESKYYE